MKEGKKQEAYGGRLEVQEAGPESRGKGPSFTYFTWINLTKVRDGSCIGLKYGLARHPEKGK